MQSYDENNKLIQTMQGQRDELLKQLSPEAARYVISEIPANGTEITINGLVWIVERASAQHGWMRLKLKRPEK